MTMVQQSYIIGTTKVQKGTEKVQKQRKTKVQQKYIKGTTKLQKMYNN